MVGYFGSNSASHFGVIVTTLSCDNNLLSELQIHLITQ